MRISDWSSDVCSADLPCRSLGAAPRPGCGAALPAARAPRPADRHLAAAVPRLVGDRAGRCGGQPRSIMAALSLLRRRRRPDRKSVVEGKSVSVRVDVGGRRIIKKKKKSNHAGQKQKREKEIT